MKVLHILKELKFSGAEIMYVSAAENFKKLGVQLYVVNTTENLGEFAREFEKAGYIVLHLPYQKGFLARIGFFLKLNSFIKKEKIDVIHNHHLGMYLTLSLIAYISDINFVHTFHSIYPSRKITLFYHRLKRRIAKKHFKCKMHTISDSVYHHEKDYFLNDSSLIKNWYNPDRFFPVDKLSKNVGRELLGIQSECFVIVSVGACSDIKQHCDIIDIMPDLVRLIPNILYLHVGEGENLECEKTKAEELEIKQFVKFISNTNDVKKYLTVSDLYLMPSKVEGISISTIEALACKIPALLYDVPGLRDFNKYHDCSVLVEPNKKKLLEEILAIWKDYKKQYLISENGYQHVNRHYSMINNSKAIYDLYN